MRTHWLSCSIFCGSLSGTRPLDRVVGIYSELLPLRRSMSNPTHPAFHLGIIGSDVPEPTVWLFAWRICLRITHWHWAKSVWVPGMWGGWQETIPLSSLWLHRLGKEWGVCCLTLTRYVSSHDMDTSVSLAVLALFLATMKCSLSKASKERRVILVLSFRLQSFMGRGGGNLK